MAKSRAVPILLVLLWHHFCYYKRHKIVLLVTILLPFILMILLYVVNIEIDSHSSDGDVAACVNDVRALLAAGPIALASSAVCSHTEAFSSRHSCLNKSKEEFHDREYFIDLLTGKAKCENMHYSSWSRSICSGNQFLDLQTNDDMAYFDVAKSYIVYYPKGNTNAERVISNLATKIQSHLDFGNICVNLDDLDSISAASTSVPKYFKDIIKTTRFGSNNRGSPCQTCATPIKTRIVGVADEDEAVQWVKDNLRNDSSSNPQVNGDAMPLLWGIVGFKSFGGKINVSKSNDNQKIIEYDLVFDSASDSSKINPALLSLQGLIEDALLMEIGGIRYGDLWAPYLRQLPNKCWDHPPNFTYKAVYFGLPLLLIISFLMSPVNALDQMVTEKMLNLREYLGIMGVGSFKLRFSWWLFYMIFLIPLSIVLSVMIAYVPPGHFFRNTNLAFIFVTLILYNMSQLSLAFFLASIMTTTRRTGMMFTFLNLIFWILGAFLYPTLSQLTGSLYYGAHILSCLHGAVPLVLSVAYLTSWEEVWLGAQESNSFVSPSLLDHYGGIGAAMIWLAINTIMYMVFAWYIEKVFPGRFGIKHKPWFLLLPSYWCPRLNSRKSSKLTASDSSSLDFVGMNGSNEGADQSGLSQEVGIKIQNLTKIYDNGQVGVNNLTINFYKHEITAFLGQNGAGKSTTMNALVGIISPTSGHVEIDGEVIDSNADRPLIGFVPQHDILYPTLTLEEHLVFYGALKGLGFAESKNSIKNELIALDLDRARATTATSLSGGQKRKLSILTAYLGAPAAIILDEPTSGVDPFSRRAIWELMIRNRFQSTTLLSTHQMQEADMLGDRIAIISMGKLSCYGPPMSLKAKYGSGVRLTVAMKDDDDSSFNLISDVIQTSALKGVTLEKRAGNDVTFVIPMMETRSEKFADFLSGFEAKQKLFNYDSYGLSEASMEDVFFRAIDLSRDALPEKTSTTGSSKERDMHAFDGDDDERATSFQEIGIGKSNDEDISIGAKDKNRYTETVEDGKSKTYMDYTPNQGLQKLLDQTIALLEKRFLFTIRSIQAIIRQIILPLCFIALLLIITNKLMSPDSDEGQVHLWNKYSTNMMFQFSSNMDAYSKSTDLVHTLAKSGPGIRCAGDGNQISRFHCKKEKNIKLPVDGGQSETKTDEMCSSCTGYCNNGKARALPYQTIRTNDIVFNLNNQTQSFPVVDWIVQANSSRFIVVGGYQFDALSNADFQLLNQSILNPLIDSSTPNTTELAEIIQSTIRRNRVILWSKLGLEFAMLNGFNNIQLRSVPQFNDYSIKMNFRPVKLNKNYTSVSDSVSSAISQSLSGFFLIVAFNFSTFSIAISIMYEKETGLKRLQRICGASGTLYWLCNFVCDLIFYFITLAIICILLRVVPNMFQDHVAKILFLMAPYGFMVIWFFYMVSFFFETLPGLSKFFIIGSLVFSYAGSVFCAFNIAYFTCEKIFPQDEGSQCLFSWAQYVEDIIRVYPPFYLADAIIFLTFMVVLGQSVGDLPNFKDFMDNIYTMDYLGKYMVTAFVVGFIFMIITLLMERMNVDFSCSCGAVCCGCRRKKKNKSVIEPSLNGIGQIDYGQVAMSNQYAIDSLNDVRGEEHKVLNQPAGTDPLEVRQMKKTYPGAGVPAVNSISFSVPQQQCFGLLGINGAGKTTLFKMLTGFLEPSKGSAMIDGSDLYKGRDIFSKSFSYCPQDNILMENVSVLEHLKVFTRLRGVPGRARPRLIQGLMDELDLTKYKNVYANHLSGGNQRKLQFSLALIGYPSLIFLDEPTTGMDPGARRRTWRAIETAIRRGSAVVLTSHTMEECEELCHRLAIMVLGQFYCIGSVQYLKNKFGNRYIFKFRLASGHENISSNVDGHMVGNVEQLKLTIANQYGTANLVEEHPTLLNYEISASDVRLSDLFKTIYTLRQQFPDLIADFTVSQLALEQVFVNLAQMQERIQSGVALQLNAAPTNVGGSQNIPPQSSNLISGNTPSENQNDQQSGYQYSKF